MSMEATYGILSRVCYPNDASLTNVAVVTGRYPIVPFVRFMGREDIWKTWNLYIHAHAHAHAHADQGTQVIGNPSQS